MPSINPALNVFLLKSNPLLIMSVKGSRNITPRVVLIPVKVNASMLCIPMDWATKEDPQITAVIRRHIIPDGLVRRISVSFSKNKAREIYIKGLGFAR